MLITLSTPTSDQSTCLSKRRKEKVTMTIKVTLTLTVVFKIIERKRRFQGLTSGTAGFVKSIGISTRS